MTTHDTRDPDISAIAKRFQGHFPQHESGELSAIIAQTAAVVAVQDVKYWRVVQFLVDLAHELDTETRQGESSGKQE